MLMLTVVAGPLRLSSKGGVASQPFFLAVPEPPCAAVSMTVVT